MIRPQQDRHDDFVGVPRLPDDIVAQRDAVSSASVSITDGDLSKVIRFTKQRRDQIPNGCSVSVGPDDRFAPPAEDRGRAWMTALIGGSFIVHAGVCIVLNADPPPLASVGLESISVEIVLSTDLSAGPAEKSEKSEEANREQADLNSVQQVEPPEPAAEQLEANVEPEQPPTSVLPSVEPPPVLAAPSAVEPVPSQPTPAPPARSVESKREARSSRLKPGQHPARERHAMLPANPRAPATAAGGLGRGRSDADSNYRGLVAAHLARYKRFPADARTRGEQGIATVSFSLDGSGRVTSVALSRGSGASSLDQEVQAMVHRASPFPAPPGGRPMSFTVPVSFRLQ